MSFLKDIFTSIYHKHFITLNVTTIQDLCEARVLYVASTIQQSKVKQAYPEKTGTRVSRTQAEVMGSQVLGSLKMETSGRELGINSLKVSFKMSNLLLFKVMTSKIKGLVFPKPIALLMVPALLTDPQLS